MFSNKDIEKAFEKTQASLEKPVSVFLIGGCAMTFRNLKPATKDVDALFEDEIQENDFLQALLKSGFNELFPGSKYLDLKAKDIVIDENGLQIDLFTRQVMGGLMLTESMKMRAEKHRQIGKLAIFLASLEDIYLFKAITSRPFPRDFEDLVTIQQSSPDWNTIYKEYVDQVKGKPIEKNLLEKARKLTEAGISNPFIKKIRKNSL